ncbi:MAG TPA: hypothetical protein VE422_03460 [Terriglobia bacterium]|nr:hypothetical protein [Terriglobia bacterium]
MAKIRNHLRNAVVVSVLAAVQAGAQVPHQSTRFTVAAAPTLSQPKGEFRQNVGNGFGMEGALLYHLDRSGLLSVRFDASWLAYGHETKRVPFSETVGNRILVNVTTTNSITALSFGPELSLPRGPVRPYVNAAFSGLFFRTSSSVKGITNSDGESLSTTNFSDGTGARVYGGGLRIPLGTSSSRISLDVGIRYHRGGEASYLREGSIQDNPGGSISITPLNSRTPYMAYLIGIRYRIPFNSPNPCPRLLC